ncbi:predicted protein [Chaetomium globosum CBS 148.51]|uniref:Uncharacterized protein n=1 Tax=Chaetomium globosum (strain ATCC 6205 / CBS 148.51 / DSM 1962 / NBRC 6347 / NRRL 1970) TaxID=306901 RepID=Q2GPY4_CHAGB|nr:uncharacterized protein CHGG_09970 [Chaetomium globosum CBS 148.51]EAQ83566.1 predicted protein [Chaetomium globosum CBS 148.51]
MLTAPRESVLTPSIHADRPQWDGVDLATEDAADHANAEQPRKTINGLEMAVAASRGACGGRGRGASSRRGGATSSTPRGGARGSQRGGSQRRGAGSRGGRVAKPARARATGARQSGRLAAQVTEESLA